MVYLREAGKLEAEGALMAVTVQHCEDPKALADQLRLAADVQPEPATPAQVDASVAQLKAMLGEKF